MGPASDLDGGGKGSAPTQKKLKQQTHVARLLPAPKPISPPNPRPHLALCPHFRPNAHTTVTSCGCRDPYRCTDVRRSEGQPTSLQTPYDYTSISDHKPVLPCYIKAIQAPTSASPDS